MSQAEAGLHAGRLEHKLICHVGVRNAALIARLLGKRLRKQLADQKKINSKG
jgi:hypothetical protein